MNPKLTAEIEKQAERFGVTAEQILGRDTSRRASAARRAVWAALLTRNAGGDFPATLLAEVFNRQPQMIRDGVTMHKTGKVLWPRQNADTLSPERLRKRLKLFYARYRETPAGDPLRPALRAEVARIRTLLGEAE